MRIHLGLTLSLLGLMGCCKVSEPPVQEVRTPASPAAAPTPAAAEDEAEPSEGPTANPSYEAYDGPLVTSGWKGVLSLDASGEIERVISDKGGEHPRWLVPGESLVVLRRDKGLSLVEIEFASGAERVIARDLVGDALQCPEGSTYDLDWASLEEFREELDVQDDWHLRVSAERGLACIWLMDRNFNMHSAAVEAKVHLDEGAVDRQLLRAMHCTPEPKWVDDDPACTSLRLLVEDSSPDSKELGAIGPHHVHDGAVWLRGQRNDELVAGPFPGHPNPEYPDDGDELLGLVTFEPASLSPSGRWAVLWGNSVWGDLLHSQWILLDTQSGEIFAVTEPKWPAPLSHEALSRLEVDNDIMPESTKVWLSGDRLVMGNWLIIPGEKVVELPGALAR